MVSVAFDLGTIRVIYLLGKRIGGAGVGLTAAIFLSINPLHVRFAQMVNVDIPLAFFALCSLYLITMIVEEPTRRRYLLCGLSIGLAAATKYTGAFLVPVFIVAHLLNPDSRADLKKALYNRTLILSLAIIPATFLLLNPYIVLDFEGFRKGFSFEQAHMALGHLGTDPSEGSGAFYLFGALPRVAGWPVVLLSLVGIVEAARRRLRAYVPLIAFLVLYFSIISLWAMRADRYLIPALPVLLVLGASGLFFGVELIFRSEARALVRRIALGVLLLAAAAVPARETYAYQRSHWEPDTRTVASRWIAEHQAEITSVAMTNLGLTLDTRKINYVSIPFYPVYPELTAAFYRPELYSDVDLVVASSFDYGRYKTDPARYRRFIEFYERIEREWKTEAEFHRSADQEGPDITLIRPVRAERDTLTAPMLEPIVAAGNEDWVFDFLIRLGIQSFNKERYSRSILFLDAANSLRPDDLRTLEYRGKSLLQIEQYREGEAVCEHALRLSPDNLEMRALYARSFLGQGRTGEAEREFLRILTVDPKSEAAYMGLGSLYAQTGEKAKLLELLERQKKH